MPCHRRTHRQPATLAAALVLALSATLAGSGTASAEPRTGPRAVPAQDVSPAGCVIQYVADPHPSKSVPGAVKVNAKAQCNRVVDENDLSVTLFGDNMKVLRETAVKSTGKAFVLNESTYISCTNFTDEHTFQGAAMGTSFEGGKPFVQFKFGRKVSLKCGY